MKRKERNKKQKKSKILTFFKVMFLTFLAFLMIGVIGVGVLVVKYNPMMSELSLKAEEKIDLISTGTFNSKTKTVIYDKEKNVIGEVSTNDYHYIKFEDIKRDIINSFIAIEDERYFEHKGVDFKAITRAGVQLLKNDGEITQGGSTITQQLVKNVFLTQKKTYLRKIEEILIARKLEDIYSKEEILEFYLNNIYFGHGAYGIESASRIYFDKPSKDLTLSEMAMLAGLPNNPSQYNPVKYMNNALERRDLILTKMKEYEFITKEEYEKAKKENIELKISKRNANPESYAVSYAISSATKIIMEKEGFNFRYWFDSNEERDKYWSAFNEKFEDVNKRIRSGGYSIYTSIDMEKQAELQKSINKKLTYFKQIDSKTGLYKTQGSGVLIDNQTGELLAIVGGRTQEGVDNTFNRGFLAYRQPGSTIKPLVAYTPAFERGMLSSTIVTDEPIENGPKNAGGRYHGKVALRKAIEKSYNTIPYRLMNEYGSKNMLSYLIDMDFTGISPYDESPIIAVGGFTYGTTALEMAGAYSALARNGDYIKPTGIRKIVDINKNVVYENRNEKKRVYDSGSAYLMTDVLKGVVLRGTGRGLSLGDMPTAGKTGTTNGNKDAWFAGYTPYYTTVIWVGNDMPESLPISGGTYPGRVWKDFMLKIHKGLDIKEFEIPDRISYAYVNPQTGEVDKENNHNGWEKELVPETYYIHQVKEKAKRSTSYNSIDIYKEYGTTNSGEKRRIQEAEQELMRLEGIDVCNPNDYDFIDGVIKSCKISIDRVSLEAKKNELYTRYNREVERIKEEKTTMETSTVTVNDNDKTNLNKPEENEEVSETEKPKN